MPWKECHVMDERLRFVARPPDDRHLHRPNQRTYVSRHSGSADAAPTFPRPEQADASAMPRDDRLRLNDDEPRAPVTQTRDSQTQRHRSTFPRARRCGCDRCSTCSWWRSASTSRCSAIRDRISPSESQEGRKSALGASPRSLFFVRCKCNDCNTNDLFSRDRVQFRPGWGDSVSTAPGTRRCGRCRPRTSGR